MRPRREGHARRASRAAGCAIAGGTFTSDRAAEAAITDAALRALATPPGQALTYTCAPPGSGTRIGIDRDLDGSPDGLPEPGTAISLAAGAALLAALSRRRSRTR